MTDELSKIDVSRLQLLNGIEHRGSLQQSSDARTLHWKGVPSPRESRKKFETRLETAPKVHRHNKAPSETFDPPDTRFNNM